MTTDATFVSYGDSAENDTRNSEPPERTGPALTRALLRAELVETLDAIGYRINVPKRMTHACKKARSHVRVMREENPAGLAAIVGVVALAGAAIVLGVRAFVK